MVYWPLSLDRSDKRTLVDRMTTGAVGRVGKSVRTLSGNIVLMLVSTAVVCFVVEVTLAMILPKPILWLDPQERYLPDAEIGHKLVPLQVAYTHSFPVRTNSFGFRNREIAQIPAADTFRILCLGDSLTFGAGVAEEETYPRQLESRLNANAPLRVEVINTGVPGYDTWQEVAFFRRQGLEFHPNLVVLGFYGNDVVPKPSKVVVADERSGRVERQGFDRIVPDAIVHLLKRSVLLLFLRDRYVKLSNQIAPSSASLHQRAMLTGTSDEFLETGWQEVERSLQELISLSRERQFHLLIVAFPMAEQLLRDYPRADYQSRLKLLADRHHIPLLDLKPAFEKNFSGFGSLFIEWDGHPNGKAFSIAAEEIEHYILDELRVGKDGH